MDLGRARPARPRTARTHRARLTAGSAAFGFGRLWAGLGPVLSALVAARLVQGVGAAAMMPSSLALIRKAYPDPAGRVRAVALWAVCGAVASAAGPVADGAASLASSRMIFLTDLPASAVDCELW